MSLGATICKRGTWGIGPCIRSLPCDWFWDCSPAEKKSPHSLFCSQPIIVVLKETELISKHGFLRGREIISRPVQIPHSCCQRYQVHSSLLSKLSRWPCSAGHVGCGFLLKYDVKVSEASGWKLLSPDTCQTISVMLLLGRKAKNK